MTTQPRPCLTTLRMMGEPRLALLRAGLVFPLSTSRLPAHPLHGCSDGTWRIHEGFAAVSVVVALRSQRRPAAPCRLCSFTIHTLSGLLRPVPAPFRALRHLLQRRAGLLVLGGAATTFKVRRADQLSRRAQPGSWKRTAAKHNKAITWRNPERCERYYYERRRFLSCLFFLGIHFLLAMYR
jgi:hypothetical protein